MNEVKKYGVYVAVLLAGLLLGYVFFNNGENHDEVQVTSAVNQKYTCSMHPQVQRGEMGACPICGMNLEIANTSGNTLSSGQFQMTENAMALANIQTTRVGVGNLSGNTLKLSGKITSNEKTNAVQTTDFDGRIEKLSVNTVGQYIKKGRQLGSIYSPELYAAQDRLLTQVDYRQPQKRLIAVARNTLGVWKLSDAQIEQIIKTKTPISSFPITANVNGTVTEVIATEGNYYKEGDALFKVSDLYTVWAVFDAYENQLPLLKIGQEVKINATAFKGKTYTAKVVFIDPVLDANKRTVSLRATLINNEGLLKPGMFVEGSIETDGTNQILTVPKSAVLWTGKRSVVYLKTDQNKPIFEMTEVTLGNALGDSYSILEGLSSGDEIVTNGTFTVDAAAQLNGKKSMMSNKDKGLPLSDGNFQLKGNQDIQENFTLLVMLYDELKNALVKSNGVKANSDAKQLLSELKKMDGSLLDGTAASYIAILKEQATIMAATQNVKEVRKAFKPFSKSLIAIASSFSDLDEPIYVQHCPMADNNKGGDWLSFQEEIQNPYFGDAMLTCGSVTNTIQ